MKFDKKKRNKADLKHLHLFSAKKRGKKQHGGKGK